MSTNHSQVRPGGIFNFPAAFGAPGPLLAGWPRPAGAEPLLPRFCCPNTLIFTSEPRLALFTPQVQYEILFRHLHIAQVANLGLMLTGMLFIRRFAENR
jgi:hypothetical protein